jgi:LPXTG-site transpeptidase (sortase) family protein
MLRIFKNMHLKNPLRLIILIVGIALLLIFFYYLTKIPVQSNSIILKQEEPSYGLPIRLKIPDINVDSAIEYVGLTTDGIMDSPKAIENVAWFELGKRPGENGSAVIAGHYGWEDGKGAVFNNLYKLQKGDKIYIEDDKGTTISFVVQESKKYDPKADASDVFASYDGKSHLNLITCMGAWDKTAGSYSERLIVFADKE